MNMTEWAEKEVELACEREAPGRKDEEWDYGCACYESALKAFKSLCEDGHSGLSISLTKHILMRLIDHKPLTPLQGTDEEWEERIWREGNGERHYQNKRYSALFKVIDKDGNVTYDDVDRIICKNEFNSSIPFHNGLAIGTAAEFMPKITFPYVPLDKPWVVTVEDNKLGNGNGDFDALMIKDLYSPDAKNAGDITKHIGRCYIAEDEWKEIPTKLYLKKLHDHQRTSSTRPGRRTWHAKSDTKKK